MRCEPQGRGPVKKRFKFKRLKKSLPHANRFFNQLIFYVVGATKTLNLLEEDRKTKKILFELLRRNFSLDIIETKKKTVLSPVVV